MKTRKIYKCSNCKNQFEIEETDFSSKKFMVTILGTKRDAIFSESLPLRCPLCEEKIGFHFCIETEIKKNGNKNDIRALFFLIRSPFFMLFILISLIPLVVSSILWCTYGIYRYISLKLSLLIWDYKTTKEMREDKDDDVDVYEYEYEYNPYFNYWLPFDIWYKGFFSPMLSFSPMLRWHEVVGFVKREICDP